MGCPKGFILSFPEHAVCHHCQKKGVFILGKKNNVGEESQKVYDMRTKRDHRKEIGQVAIMAGKRGGGKHMGKKKKLIESSLGGGRPTSPLTATTKITVIQHKRRGMHTPKGHPR